MVHTAVLESVQQNAITLVEELIDNNTINGKQATTLILGILNKGYILPETDKIDYDPIKIYYRDSTETNEMINKISTTNNHPY